jgi:hypothetical protein
VSDDPELRARLERLASTAGDPPERGLDRVAARRHRRLRRRRGAVVTAAALAVLLGGVSLVMDGGSDDDQVAVSPAGRPTGAAAQLPDAVEVRCTPTGIVIPVASVRPQRDGMHVRVFNELATPTEVSVIKDDDWAGRHEFQPGVYGTMRQPVAPGTLRIGCVINGLEQSLTVELVDVHGYYQEPELDCPSEDRELDLKELGAAAPHRSMSTTTFNALRSNGFAVDELKVGPVQGYPSQRLGDPTDDPVVQVDRRSDTVAFVHLEHTAAGSDAPWRAVTIDGCESFLAEATATEATTPA